MSDPLEKINTVCLDCLRFDNYSQSCSLGPVWIFIKDPEHHSCWSGAWLDDDSCPLDRLDII